MAKQLLPVAASLQRFCNVTDKSGPGSLVVDAVDELCHPLT
jgi:hypothetical protein